MNEILKRHRTTGKKQQKLYFRKENWTEKKKNIKRIYLLSVFGQFIITASTMLFCSVCLTEIATEEHDNKTTNETETN